MRYILGMICFSLAALYYSIRIIKNRKKISRNTMIVLVIGVICFIIAAILHFYQWQLSITDQEIVNCCDWM